MIKQRKISLTRQNTTRLDSPIVDGAEDLKNIKRLFWQLLKDYPDGSISIIDKDANFIYTGGELYKQLNTDPREWIGKKMFNLFPKQFEERIRLEISTVFEGKSVADFEIEDCCFHGETYAMDAFPLIERDHSIKRAGIIIRNITKLKKAEDRLRTALEKEKELSELKSRFVSMASHEFRTPLSTVLSSAYLLSKYSSAEEQPKRERHIDRIVSSVNMLTDILNDFLSIGKIEEGKITVKYSEIRIEQFMETALNEAKQLLKKNQEINYEHSGHDFVVLDAGLLKHIVLNLLTNAIKFSDEGTKIKIRTILDDNIFTLSVKDHGLGIPLEDQKHLFERFFRGSNVAHIQGTGLGLHIVARYSELMNGKVKVKSDLGKGTEFIITFKHPNQSK